MHKHYKHYSTSYCMALYIIVHSTRSFFFRFYIQFVDAKPTEVGYNGSTFEGLLWKDENYLRVQLMHGSGGITPYRYLKLSTIIDAILFSFYLTDKSLIRFSITDNVL